MLWQRTVATAHPHDAQRSKVLLYLPFWDDSPLAPVLGLQLATTTYVIWANGWKVGGAGARSRGRSSVLAVLCVVEMGAHGPIPSMPEILPRHSFDCHVPDPFESMPAVTLPLACGSAGFRTLTPSLRSLRIVNLELNTIMLKYTYSPSNVAR